MDPGDARSRSSSPDGALAVPAASPAGVGSVAAHVAARAGHEARAGDLVVRGSDERAGLYEARHAAIAMPGSTISSSSSSGTWITTRSGTIPQVTMIAQKIHSWRARIAGVAAIAPLGRVVDANRADGDEQASDPHEREEIGEVDRGERVEQLGHRSPSLASGYPDRAAQDPVKRQGSVESGICASPARTWTPRQRRPARRGRRCPRRARLASRSSAVGARCPG